MKKRCFRRLSYGDLLNIVEHAVEAYVEEHGLEAHEGNDPDILDVARWEWCRMWLHKHLFNVPSTLADGDHQQAQ